ncbi:MAG: tRNA threonylcarbamoyladenosine dehydratase [Clostridiales bacterium]|nr:tRNA threonylcarbamoyladenosine dehydratase [Clostridiales bacterium]
MNDAFERFALLVGSDAASRVACSHVTVVGLGGVGGQATEALARCGVGALTLIDGDIVQRSNINRQIVADTRTLGRLKAEAMAERLLNINPDLAVRAVARYVTPETVDAFLNEPTDYVVDAIDYMNAKIALITACRERGIPIVSSAGAACRLDPTQLACVDLFSTQYDPMARRMRKRLRQLGVTTLDVVCSREQPVPTRLDPENNKHIGGSAVFVTAAAGLLLARHVVMRLAATGGESDAT